MILVFEMVWPGTAHSVTNSTMIQTIAQAFPYQAVRVFAESTHLTELESDPGLRQQSNLSLHAIQLSSRYRFRPHIVSVRRGLRELWTLLTALRAVPPGESCLVMLISATPTAIFLGAALSRLMHRQIRVQAGLHGNLNDAFGWRSRNPLIRIFDLRAAIASYHSGRVRFLVLEEAIRRSLIRRSPGTAKNTDVIPHPVNPADAEDAEPLTLSTPLRIGLVGLATEAKGVSSFLTLARTFDQTLPGMVRFHLVGHPAPGIDLKPFAVLREALPIGRPTRAEFVEKLRGLHYVCLPLQPVYYDLSASGALIDAINWLKPVIATRVPIIVDLFQHFGDIGVLCNDLEEMQSAIQTLALGCDQARYDRQVANIRHVRNSRWPSALASVYRTVIETGFPGLLTDNRTTSAVPLL